MIEYTVHITEDNGDVSIFTNATSVDIRDGVVEVAWDDECTVYSLEQLDELIVRINR